MANSFCLSLRSPSVRDFSIDKGGRKFRISNAGDAKSEERREGQHFQSLKDAAVEVVRKENHIGATRRVPGKDQLGGRVGVVERDEGVPHGITEVLILLQKGGGGERVVRSGSEERSEG